MRRWLLIFLALMVMVGSAFADERFNEGDGGSGSDSTTTANGWFVDMVDSHYIDYDSRPQKTNEWVYSVFFIDTIGWKADTTMEEYDPYIGIPGFHPADLNYRQVIRWCPVLDTTYIGKFISDKREPLHFHKLLVKREPK